MDAKWYRRLGERIARFRAHGGLSQEALAEKADIAPSYLARIETGARRPTLDVLGRLADALGIPLHRLIIDERASRAGEAQEGWVGWGKPARQLVQLIPELSDPDVELLMRVATRFHRQ